MGDQVKVKLEMIKRITRDHGFIAALDQSGGSTPSALKRYGVSLGLYEDADGMFDYVHDMRSRLIKDDAFNKDYVTGAILFEDTVDRLIDGIPTSEYLWQNKKIVPFLKIDCGLRDTKNGVQVMKYIHDLDSKLDKANAHNIFGTKMRSLIHEPDPEGIKLIVKQQFAIAKIIISKGLVPIIEPEVSIFCEDKTLAEQILKQEISSKLEELDSSQVVMLKITIPEEPNFYSDFTSHPNVLKVIALSGGYKRAEACYKLAKNDKVAASFSRALLEGLFFFQSAQDYTRQLAYNVSSIFDASA